MLDCKYRPLLTDKLICTNLFLSSSREVLAISEQSSGSISEQGIFRALQGDCGEIGIVDALGE